MKIFHLSLRGVLDYMPALIGGIACFVLTLVLANFVSKMVSRFTSKRTKDSLIANFMGKIFWTIVFTLGVVMTLGILGLGTISNKILAAAGITTFVIGFALKDIGENFLAGLMLAFGRPYHVGNIIECTGIVGSVRDMTMRQTTVETTDGKLVMIPNSLIINNPLFIYKKTDVLSDTFNIKVGNQDVKKAIAAIEEVINGSQVAINSGDKSTKVLADSFMGDKINLQVTYWTDQTQRKGSRTEIKSQIIQLVNEKLKAAEIGFSG